MESIKYPPIRSIINKFRELHHHLQIEDDGVLDVIYAALFISNMDALGAPQSIVQKIGTFRVVRLFVCVRLCSLGFCSNTFELFDYQHCVHWCRSGRYSTTYLVCQIR